MLNVLLRSLRQAGRVLRNFITRPIFIIRSKLFYLTNLGRYLAKLPSLFTALPKAIAKKPGKREDYASVGRVFMAKKYIVLILIAVIVLPVLFYMFLWPVIQPLWFTVSYTVGDSRYDTYSGKVRIYYDEERKQQMFEGRLLDGKYTDRGTLYHETGFVNYNGTFKEGVYDGFGSIYEDDGMMLYQGGLEMGMYQGNGTLFGETGPKEYVGEFEKGLFSGKGIIYFPDAAGSVRYDGSFLLGLFHGSGVLYSEPGVILYRGFFENGLYHGLGELYYENAVPASSPADPDPGADGQAGPDAGAVPASSQADPDAGADDTISPLSFNPLPNGPAEPYAPGGRLLYKGEFARGLYHGWGELYDIRGNLMYEGEFQRGEKSGYGTEYDENGILRYKGDFKDDEYDGVGMLYDDNGDLIYEGGFAGGLFSGSGKLYLPDGSVYEGEFRGGAADGPGVLTQSNGMSYTGDFAGGNASGYGSFTDKESGVAFTGLFEDGMISPAGLFGMDTMEIYEAFSSGMTMQEDEDDYYMYNTALGYVLRFLYATEMTPARLIQIFMSPGAKLPNVGGAPDMADSSSLGSGQMAPDAERPSGRVMSLLKMVLPADAYAVKEVRGTVLSTTWKLSNATTALYVFEPYTGDADLLLPEDREPGTTADLEYYILFGLEEVAPEE